jgi:integrase
MVDLKSAMDDPGILGVLVHWEMRTTGAMLTPEELSEAAENHGVSLDIAPISPESVFRRIVRALTTIRSPLISKVVQETDGVVVYAVVDTSLEGDEKVGQKVGLIVNRVAWAKIACEGVPRFVFEVEDELAQIVSDRYEFGSKFLDNNDVRRILSAKMKDWGAIRVFGRLQFLGRSRIGEALSLKAALAEVGTQCWLMPQLNIEDTHASIGHYSREQYDRELARYKEELARWNAGERAPRPTTLEQRLRQFEQLKEEIQALAEVVTVDTSDVLDELAGLRRAVAALLNPEPDAEEPPVEGTAEPADPEIAPAEPEIAPAEPAAPPAVKGKPAPPARPKAPKNALEDLTIEQLRVQARNAKISPMPRSRKALIRALRSGVGS